MTEAEWVACKEPGQMLRFALQGASTRKTRLAAIALARNSFANSYLFIREALGMAEEVADGIQPVDDLTATYQLCKYALTNGIQNVPKSAGGMEAPSWNALNVQCGVGSALEPEVNIQRLAHFTSLRFVKRARDLAIVRCLFDGIFYPAISNLGDLPLVVASLAEGAYEDRVMPSAEMDRVRLAVLSDAVEEAGIIGEMLAHLRGPGPHFRGCWVIDALSGRQ